MTLVQLAKKFGWPSVIISIIILPVSLLWSKLLAFPVWLKSKPKYTVENTLTYPKHDDLFAREFYFTEKSVVGFPSGWNCHIDEEGGKFFESFWGIIHCLDVVVKRNEDDRISTMIITPNFLSWLTLDEVYVEFANTPEGTYGHRIRFFFPLDGPNMYNPFTLLTMGFIMTGMNWFSKVSFKKFKCEKGVFTTSTTFPDEPEGKKREDGSFEYRIEDLPNTSSETSCDTTISQVEPTTTI